MGKKIEIALLVLNSKGYHLLGLIAPAELHLYTWQHLHKLVSPINTRWQCGVFRFVSIFLKFSICLSLSQLFSGRLSLSVCLRIRAFFLCCTVNDLTQFNHNWIIYFLLFWQYWYLRNFEPYWKKSFSVIETRW